MLGPALLAIVILRVPDRAGVVAVVASAAPLPLVAAVLLNLVNIHLKVVRWDVLLATRGIRYPKRRAWGAFLTSLYVGMLTPGRVGDALRAQYLRHDLDVPYAEGIASIVMDRLCDLYVLAAFVAYAAVRYAPVLAGKLAWITWAGVAGVVALPLLLVVPGVADRALALAWKKVARGESADGLPRFLEALRANVGRSLLVTIPLTVATFLVNYVQGWLIARAIGLDLALVDVACLLSITSLLGLLPVSVSGVGVRELFFALIFPFLGLPAASGVSFGLLVFFVIYLVIVAIGFISWQIAPPPSGSRRPDAASAS
ncbi:MAG TPA: lysylphosphatidylglycerol synthase transmembrane domain-containing protein [Byssovorax sp.]|jgi:hypothetical protein